MNARRAAWFSLLFVVTAYPAFVRTSARPKTSPVKPSTPGKASGVASGERVASPWLTGMTLREKIGQMVVVACFGEDPYSGAKQFRDYVHYVRDLHVGGFIVANRIVNGSVRNA